jgi:hypothetical protein
MHAFNQSLSYDKRMHAADIRGSISYAKALAKVGILTGDEEARLVRGLEQVGEEWTSGQVCNFSIGVRRGLTERAIPLVQSGAGRRRHPHRERAAPERDHRPTRRQAAHGPLSQRPGRDRHAALAHGRSQGD